MNTAADTDVLGVKEDAKRPDAGRVMAHVVSVVFHPLFVPVFVALFLLFIHPFLFAGYEDGSRWRLVATVFVNFTLFPAVTVFFCWRLKFIDSISMHTQKERIIPLAATMIFYFWGWYVLRNISLIPDIFRQFLLGSFITIIAAWLANIYFKVSLHALAMGGMATYCAIVVFGYEGGSAQYLAVCVLVAGLVCSARLWLASHKGFEVFAGLFIGGLCQVLAAYL